MLSIFKLLLPALMPSWRFFSEIAPSPRIEISWLESMDDEGTSWREFRPRPEHVSPFQMFLRMFYNAHWNESLFLMSCAERHTKNPTEHSINEIVKRIKADFGDARDDDDGRQYMRFRLVFVYRDQRQLKQTVTFVSPAYCLSSQVSK